MARTSSRAGADARSGLVFQFFQLLPTLTVAENVMLPMDFCRGLPAARGEAARSTCSTQVGVADQANKLPSALSGGQQQRVAIARALANEPAVVLADEPTGNLDSATAAEVLALFRELADAGGTTVLIATHERDIARLVDRRVQIVDGAVARMTDTLGARRSATSGRRRTRTVLVVLAIALGIAAFSAVLSSYAILTRS